MFPPRRPAARGASAALAATLCLAVAVSGPVTAPVSAQPAPAAPADGTDDLAALGRLSDEAGALGEELNTARSELDTARSGLDAARAEQYRLEVLAGVSGGRAALADDAAGRDQRTVDDIAVQHYRGGGTDATRAMVLATDPADLVNRLELLRVLSGGTTRSLDDARQRSGEAHRLRDEAARAKDAARAATDDAGRRTRDIETRTRDLETRSAELNGRIDEVRRRVDALAPAQREQWVGGPVVPAGYSAPAADGVNAAALRAGLSKVGSPYSWGATGPSEFDCSGLMVWSYAQVGKSLPRSSQQQAAGGAPVAPSDVQPGDLVIYYPGATHVGMYAGDGLVLHAPDYGIPVKLEKMDAMPVSAIRRY